jgi:Fic family protein
MAGLLEELEIGQWRTRNVQAYRSAVVYAQPRLIHPKLTSLLRDFNLEMAAIVSQPDSAQRLEHVLQASTVFFRMFLLIHPFINGNGRVARILCGEILRPFSAVPVSLSLQKYDSKSRSLYADIMERCPVSVAPVELFVYACDCAVQQASTVRYLVASSTPLTTCK